MSEADVAILIFLLFIVVSGIVAEGKQTKKWGG